MSADRFCNLCDISLDLHYGEGDCENAERRAWLIERYPLMSGGPLIRSDGPGAAR